MASSQNPFALSSFSTAVVFLPSADVQRKLNIVRSAWDKSYPRWTAHFTVLFPFCEPAYLAEAAARLHEACSDVSLSPIATEVDRVDTFSMRTYKTVYLAPSRTAAASMKAAWRVAASTFSYSGRDFIPHLTIGQTPHTDDALNFLVGRGDALVQAGLQWTTDCFVLLRKDESDGGRMKIAHVVPFQPSARPPTLAPRLLPAHRSDEDGSWVSASPVPEPSLPIGSLRVATYNVLEDPAFPSRDRVSSVVRAIINSRADVVALQEISQLTLRLLLEDASLRSMYKWCSHGPTIVLPLARNLLFLSKAAIPFSWTTAHLGDKHKPAHIAIVEQPTGPKLIIAAVHFSAGHSPEISSKRTREFSNLVAHLQSEYSDDDWIVLGDTNMQPADDDSDILLDDAWHSAGSPSEHGPTFEPAVNALAAQTSRKDPSSKRYDRIYTKQDRFTVLEFTRFGLDSPDQPASDHWGIAASLTPSASPSLPVLSETPAPAQSHALLVPSSLTDAELLEIAARDELIPNDDHSALREAAVETVRQVLCPSAGNANVRMRLAVVGSFAFGVDLPSSDVDCLVVGNISPATFWQLSLERTRTLGWPNAHNLRLRRFVKDAAVQMLELDVGGVKMDLQYCPAPQVAESWDEVPTLPSNSTIFSLPASSLRTLNAFRDLLVLRALITANRLPAFTLAHRSLRHFCKRRGIYSSKFGYLGSFHLSILTVRLLESLPQSITAAQIVRSFISHYSAWDWDVDAAYIGPSREYSRSTREAMVILAPEKPSLNIASAASRSTMLSISRALKDADRLLDNGAAWTTVCGPGLLSFLSSHECFAKIDVSFWGTSSMTGRGLVGHLESRFVHLLVQLQTSVPDVHAHLWPERLSDASGHDASTLQAFYLIGLSGSRLADTVQTRTALLEAFAEDIRGHARYYDASYAFVYASEVSRDALSAVEKDAFDWPDGGFDEPDAEDSDDDADTRADEEATSQDDTFALGRRKKGKKQKTQQKSAVGAQIGGKLRPSTDVYNRLMWDPSVSSEDYVIGYEDRFKGLREMPLVSWQRELTDDAFIPFHRVVHFRRRSDNVVVWDRAKRLDLVFGSGSAQSS